MLQCLLPDGGGWMDAVCVVKVCDAGEKSFEDLLRCSHHPLVAQDAFRSPPVEYRQYLWGEISSVFA